MLKSTAAFATLALLAGSPALAQEAPAGVKVTAEGFNDAKDMPLYTFFRDTAGQPATGVSAAWPRAKP